RLTSFEQVGRSSNEAGVSHRPGGRDDSASRRSANDGGVVPMPRPRRVLAHARPFPAPPQDGQSLVILMMHPSTGQSTGAGSDVTTFVPPHVVHAGTVGLGVSHFSQNGCSPGAVTVAGPRHIGQL